MKKWISRCLLILCLINLLILTGCGPGGPEEEPPGEPVKGTICHAIIACKYLIFEPSDFIGNYENGDAYSKGIDAWTQLRYSAAEEKLLLLEQEIQEKGPAFPEDRAFIRETLGCLYIDMAKYQSAYEYLMDAYITMKEVYDQEPYYQNAVSVALCHYYYALGDYERCAREVQILRDNHVTDNSITDQSKSTWEFLNIILNNLTAQMSFDCGRYADAWNTYTESMKMCQAGEEAMENDRSFMRAMLVNVFENLGDTAYRLGPEYQETAITTFYDGTIQILESNFSGPLAGAIKARILVKKGYNLVGFAGKADEGFEIAAEGMTIQEKLYGSDEPYPGLVDTYLKYGDMLGYIYNDREEAEAYYEKALSLSAQAYGETHPETAKVYETLGRFYLNRVQDGGVQAISHLQRALEICKNLLAENTALAAGIELQLAAAYKGAGDDASSDMYKEHALAIYEKLGMSLAGAAQAEG